MGPNMRRLIPLLAASLVAAVATAATRPPLLDAAKMNRRAPAIRAASSRLRVAVGPVKCESSGSLTERGTLGIAAW